MAGGTESCPNWAAGSRRGSEGAIRAETRIGADRLGKPLVAVADRRPLPPQSYARMSVSLEPIVRAEDSLKSLFTPFGVLRNRFLRHTE